MILLNRLGTLAAGGLTDQQLAEALARKAGESLLKMQSAVLRAGEGREPAGLGAEGDRKSQEYLRKALARTRPQDSVLSEEAADDPKRLSAKRVWIIDPLDGTREFSEGRRDWGVHVALWSGGNLTAGAVALPRLGLVCGAPAQPPAPSTGRKIRLAVSRSRPPRIAETVAAHLGAELIPMGSAGYKVCAVASGEVDGYLHDGGQYEWDSAAPVVVARSAGLHVSRLDGTSPRYNQPDPYLPDLLVCRPELRDRLLETIKRARLSEAAARKTGD